MKIVCISDNHDQNLFTKFDIPNGDVLVHAGDLVAVGDDLERFERGAKNLGHLPHKVKFYVPGNHDYLAFSAPHEVSSIMHRHGIDMLFDTDVVVNGIRFWGSGWLQPKIGFKGEYPGDFTGLWESCPTGVDVLISHQPPYDIMDMAGPDSPIPGERIGSTVIYNQVFRKIRPQVHIFGHNHSEHGEKEIDGIEFINAALVDDSYKPAFEPIVVEIERKEKI